MAAYQGSSIPFDVSSNTAILSAPSPGLTSVVQGLLITAVGAPTAVNITDGTNVLIPLGAMSAGDTVVLPWTDLGWGTGASGAGITVATDARVVGVLLFKQI